MGCGASKAPPPKDISTPADLKAIASQHEEALRALFDKIDADSDGTLQVAEFKGVVEECTGDIDVDKFMKWYDTNGSANGTLDFAEFGWYMADTAWNMEASVDGASGKMPGLIEWFTEELDTINAAAKEGEAEAPTVAEEAAAEPAVEPAAEPAAEEAAEVPAAAAEAEAEAAAAEEAPAAEGEAAPE